METARTVYGDLLFFVNFCMDFQCLFLTAKLLRRPFGVWRSAAAAAAGALYACAALFWQTRGVVAFALDMGVCLLMCAGAFWRKGEKFRRILIPFGVYFGVSAAVGGVMSALGALLSHVELPASTGGGELGTGAFFLLAGAGGVSTFLWGRLCQRRAKSKQVALRVALGGREVAAQGVVDTANFLRDPVSGRPVVFLAPAMARTLLPPTLLPAVLDGRVEALGDLPPTLSCRVRLLPGDTVAGRRLFCAVAPDSAWLDAGRGETPVELLIAAAPLAADLGECTALLPAALITE